MGEVAVLTGTTREGNGFQEGQKRKRSELDVKPKPVTPNINVTRSK